MNSFFQRTVEALLPTAVNYAPEGTEAKAVAHQWLHALAYDFTPFAETQGINKVDLIALLKAEQIYTDQESIKDKLPTLPIKPTQTSRFTFIDLFAGIGGM
ncbi:MAG: hypothetical protein NTV75_00060 [Bacteroidia bacterium]|nr:hypothetical protein [Bacteroidia bacterium]